MKFVAAIIAHLVMATILGLGLLHAVHGRFGLLAVGVLGYLLMFAKLGCLPPKAHH
jgi:hypothetical protein